MHRWPILLLLLSLSAQAQKQHRCCMPLKGSPSVKQLGHEFRQLRKHRETDCCRRNGSRIMEVLERLQDSLGENATPTLIRQLMGRPDFRQLPDVLPRELRPGETVMGYYWRSNDFLYFIFRDGRLVENRWFHSYER